MFSVKGLKKKIILCLINEKLGLEVNHNVYVCVCVCERGGGGGTGKEKEGWSGNQVEALRFHPCQVYQWTKL